MLLGSTALVAASLASPALAADHPVASYADLVAAINAANATSGDTITLTGDVTLSGLLPAIRSGVTLIGGGHTIDGASAYRIFFIDAGSGAAISLQNVTLAHGLAQGGAGANGGGGGLGAGGAIFLNSGNLTASDVTFANNAAAGGTTSGTANTFGAGGGGGLEGSGGSGGFGGGGGGGYSGGGGGSGGTSQAGGIPGGTGGAGPGGAGGSGAMTGPGSAGQNGGAGGPDTGPTFGGAGGGGASGGGAGGGSTYGSNGGGGGGGGGYSGAGGNGSSGSGTAAPSGTAGGGGGGGYFSAGGAGGDFGGGGGGNTSTGGTGGFGGGGGGGSNGGAGGFGGGGGNSAAGGVGGGKGASGGGGGAGFGGAVFVRPGGDAGLSITGNSSFSGDTTAAGAGAAGGTSGASAGSDLFLSARTTTLSPGAGKTITFGGSIADSNAASLPGGSYTAGSGARGALALSGGGTVALGATGFAGDIYVYGTVLRATTSGAFGNAIIHTLDPTIQYSATGTYANEISLEVPAAASGDPTILQADSGVTATLTGRIHQTGTGDANQPLTIGGPGTIVLTNAANRWSGVTTINSSATLKGTSASISGASIADDGTLGYVQSASGTVGQDISGTGGITVSGLVAGNALTFNGALTNNGGMTLGAGGYVVINGSVSNGSTAGAIQVTGANDTITVTAGHSVTSSQTAGGNYASAIYGTGANFTVTNAGTITAPGDLGATFGSNGIYATNGVTVNNTGNIFGLPQGSAATYRSDGVIVFGTGVVNNTGATLSGGTLTGSTAGGGVITGGWEAVYLTNDGTVYNSGTIGGNVYSGVEIQGVGTLNNYAGGRIIGGSDGANIGNTATVYNSGLIAAGSYDSATQLVTLGAGGNGLVLHTGGTVTNTAGGVMTGGQGGIQMLGLGAMTVTNSGTITGTSTGSAGIGQSNDGSLTVTNNSGGIIAGTANAINTTSNGVVSITNNAGGTIGTGTVDNAGVFTAGGNGNAISLVSGTVTNSGTIDGAAGGVVATGALTLTNSGTITSHGTGTGNFDGVTVIGAANILNSGTIAGGGYAAIYTAAGGTITNAAAGQLIGAGSAAMVLDGGGTFNNYGSATNPGGAGVASGNANTTVNLFAGSSTGSVTLGAGNDTLAIYNGRGTSGAATVDAATGIILQNAGTLAAASFGAINMGGGTNTLMLRGTGDDTAPYGAAGSFAISTFTGASILTKADSGTWALTGAAITPSLTINAGTGGSPGSGGLLIFNGTTGLTGTINVNGATIRAATAGAFGTGTINAIDPTIQYGATGTYTNNIVLQSANPSTDPTVLQTFGTGITATLTGSITQASAGQPLQFISTDTNGATNAGTFILTNTGNSWTGATTIGSQTTLQGTSTTISGGSIVDNGTLIYTAAGVVSKNISGGGNLTIAAGGGNSVTLTGTNSWSGVTTVTSGILTGTTQAIAGGSIVDNGAIIYTGNGGIDRPQAISGSGTIEVAGSVGFLGNVTTAGTFSVTGNGTFAYIKAGRSGSNATSDGGYGSGVLLSGTNTGLVVENGVALQGGAYVGVRVTGQGSSITNLGSITNSGTGGTDQVGAGVAIYTVGGTNSVTNGSISNTTATISGSNNAIDQRGSATTALTVNNYGALLSDRYNAIEDSGNAGTLTVNNTGSAATIIARGTAGQGRAISHGATSALSVVNSGWLVGSTGGIFSNGAATITNAGTIATGSLIGGVYTRATNSGNAITLAGGTVTNNNGGQITSSTGWSGIAFSSGAGTVNNNAGATITGGASAIFSQSGVTSTTITNAGTMTADTNAAVYITTGALTLTNQAGGTIRSNGSYAIYNGGTGASSVTNAGTITGLTGSGSYTPAVYFVGANGSVTNQAGGTITGRRGVETDGANGAIINAGTITATFDNAITLLAGGSVTNQAGGILNATAFGDAWGIYTIGAVTTITNAGTINAGAGIVTGSSGTTVNNSGTINGQLQGVWANSGTQALTNSGTIGASGGYGVQMGAGGSVTNLSGGTIGGSSGAMLLAGSGGYALDLRNGSTVNGTIQAGSTNGTNTILLAGALNGAYVGGSGADNFTLLAGGAFSDRIDGGAGVDAFTTNLGSAGSATISLANVANFESLTHQSGSLTLTGAAATPTMTINAGTGGTPGSGGLLIFNGTTGLTGTINVNGATIRAATAGAFGTGTINAIDPTIQYGATGTYSNNIVLASGNPATDPTRIQADAGVIATLTGQISQSGGTAQPLIFDGLGTITLTNGANDYAGLTTISNGTVVESNTGSALGTGGATITSGAVLQFDNQTGGVNYIEGGTYSGAGTIRFTGNANAVTALGNGGNGNTIFSLSSGGLIDVVSGSVNGSSSGQGFWTNNKGSLNIASGAIFDGVEGVVIVDKLTGTGTLRGGFFGSGSTTVGIDNGSATFGGTIADSTNVPSPLNLIKAGTGTQTLTGTNSYTGTTTISGGTLALSGTGSIANTSVTDNAVFDIAGLTNGGTSVVNISGNGSILLGANTLTLSNASGTYSGSVSGTGILALAAGSEAFSGALSNTGGLTLGGTSSATITSTGSATLVTMNGTNSLTNSGVISGTALAAVRVQGGNATITNLTGGTVTGTQSGVYSDGASNTVINAGAIQGGSNLFNFAIWFSNAGATNNVTNQTGGMITGNRGIDSAGVLMLTNNGQIAGASDGSGVVTRQAGSSVTNNLGATISGGNEGVDFFGANASLTNAGTISSSTGPAVLFSSSGVGTLVNTGSISGGSNGVAAAGGGGQALNITNSGAITATGANGQAISLGAGGAVTNLAGGMISGASALSIQGSPLLLDNAGSITGMVLASGGGLTLFNRAGGTIGDGSFTVLAQNGATVTNAGAIRSANSTALWLFGGAVNVTNQAGGSIAGVFGINATALTLANAGQIVGSSSAVSASAASTVTNSGLIGNGTLSSGVFTRGINSGNAINLAGGTVTNNNGGQITSSTGWSGIAFSSGAGTVNNNAGATITGGASAIFSQSGVTSTSITNAGTMTAGTNAVIFIGAGTLTLTNQAGGTIRSNGSNAIFNAGSGASSVTNAGTIAGQQQGVWVTGGTLALTNSGSITANGGYGIIANAGGSVTDLSGGTIGGSSGSMLLTGSSAYTLDLRAGSTVNGTIQAGTTSGTNATLLAGALNGGYVGGSGADNFTLFDTGAFTGVVDGGAAIDTFTLAGNGSSTVDGSRIVNFENLIKTGTGTRTLNGSNVSFTDIQVQQGTLAVSGGNAINNGALVTVATPATLSLLSDEAIGGLAGSGAVTLGANTLILAGPQVTSFSGVISGTGGFIRAGTGATTLSGANTYTGMTEVAGGSLILGASNVIADASTLLIDTGGVLDLGQFSDTVALAVINGTLNGTGTLTATQYQLNGATVNANLGDGTLFQLGGVSLLNGTADAGNVSVNAGTLRLGAANRLADNATVAVNSGATLDLQAFNDTVGIASSSGTLNGSGTLTAGEYDLNGATVNANLGAGNLFQLGGTTLLNGTAGAANVMINGGTLRLGAAERLSDSAALAIASGGTLDLAGFQETVGTAYIAGALNGTGTLIASQYALAGGTVNANLGAGALFNQSGVSTLNGTSAATTLGIVAGTLRLGAAERLNDKIDVVINSGGVLDLNGFQETIDSLDGGGSVALGAGRLRVGADNGSSTFAGIISGAGSFEKLGTGLFVYGNSQLYTGGTTVTAGELRLLGSTAGNVNVNAGTFSGGGTINGRLSLAGGTIAPGTGAGTFGGFQSTSFTSSAGTFAVDVSPAQSDFLTVTGAATLNGGLVQTNILAPSSQFQFRQLYTVLQAGSLTGTFANPAGFVQTSTNSDLYQRLRYDLAANSVVLEIRRMIDFTAGAGSPNQASIGAALNSTRLGASDNFATLLNALGQLSPAQQSAALDTLGNEGVADSSIVLGFVADRFVDLIDNRMDGTDRLLGNGNDTFGGQPVASSRTMATIGQALSLTGGHGGGAAGTGPWMKAYGFNTRLDGTPGVANLRTNGRGFTFGLDGQVGNVVLGGAVGVVDFDAATTSRATTTGGTAWQGGLYARVRSGGSFAGVSGTYIEADYDTSRTIQVGALAGTARGNASARVWTAEAVAGHDFALSSTAQFGVLGTVRFSDIDQHAYAELGNGVFNLNHDAERRQYEIETVVARASNSFAMGNGLSLNASVRGGVAFAQGDLTAALRSTFAGAPAGTGAFSTTGASLPSSWGVVGGGLNLTPLSNRWEVSLRYEGRYGSRLAEHQVALGVGVRW